jgi:hypothetical protein
LGEVAPVAFVLAPGVAGCCGGAVTTAGGVTVEEGLLRLLSRPRLPRSRELRSPSPSWSWSRQFPPRFGEDGCGGEMSMAGLVVVVITVGAVPRDDSAPGDERVPWLPDARQFSRGGLGNKLRFEFAPGPRSLDESRERSAKDYPERGPS